MNRIAYAMAIGPVGPPLVVTHSIKGEEGISRLYRFDAEVSTFLPGPLFERLVLGRGAVLAMRVAETVRVVHGIVASVRGLPEQDDGHGLHRYSLRLVPKMWLLRRRHDSRIFQEKSAQDVIREVAEGMNVSVRFDLHEAAPKREYLTQYDETDYAFVARLCAENGWLWYFEQPQTAVASALFSALDGPPVAAALAAATLDILRDSLGRQPSGGETLVITDRHAYAPVAPSGAREIIEGALEGLLYQALGDSEHRPEGPSIALRSAGGLVSDAESIHEFSSRERIGSSKATYREFDPGRPLVALEAKEDVGEENEERDPLRAFVAAATHPASILERLDALMEDRRLELYHHEGRDLFPHWESGSKEPKKILEQARRRKKVARGRSNVARLEAGHSFKLDEHPIEIFNEGWVVTRVRHRGSSAFGDGAGSVSYENEFECVPSEVAYIPPRPTRKVVQTTMTATVVGPEGEEIHVDDQGRIKVKFHWDRAEELHEPTCWIRVMQGWAGTGWGTQMIPRVGMEAIVAFENGDPDKPLVLGCVYNRVLPTPFKLPDDKSKSGIRTRSTPRGHGFNELSFEDRTNRERIYVHAQRDLDADVGRNRTSIIGEDEVTKVRRHQRIEVGEEQHLAVMGERSTHIHRDDHLRVQGSLSETIRGAHHEHSGSRSAHISRNDETAVGGHWITDVDLRAEIRAGGAMVQGRRRATLASDEWTEVSSFKKTYVHGGDEIVLSTGGEAFIRLTKNTIQLSAPTLRLNGKDAQLVLKEGKALCKAEAKVQMVSKKIVLKSDGASLGLGSEAKLDGTRVLLNSPEQASDNIQVETPQRSIVVVATEDGELLPGARVIVRTEDGSEFMTHTGEDGSVEVDMEGSATVLFPDLSGTE